MYPYEWNGNGESCSGTAIFMIDGDEFKLNLENYECVVMIAKMLDAAHNQGVKFGASQILNAVDTVITTKAKQIGV